MRTGWSYRSKDGARIDVGRKEYSNAHGEDQYVCTVVFRGGERTYVMRYRESFLKSLIYTDRLLHKGWTIEIK